MSIKSCKKNKTFLNLKKNLVLNIFGVNSNMYRLPIRPLVWCIEIKMLKSNYYTVCF